MPQRLYGVLKTCQRAVGSPQNTPKNIKFASNSTTTSQLPYSVYTTFPQLLYNVHDAQKVAAMCCQYAHGAHTARIERSRGDRGV